MKNDIYSSKGGDKTSRAQQSEQAIIVDFPHRYEMIDDRKWQAQLQKRASEIR